MKYHIFKYAALLALTFSISFADEFEDALAAVDSAEAANTPGMFDENHFEYFDCWVENATSIIPKERSRINAVRDEALVCGCYIVRENGGFGWRGTEPKRILKVWDTPKPRLLNCPKGMNCSMDMYVAQCTDHIKESALVLSDFGKGGALEGVVAYIFSDDSTLTPFGSYFETHKENADSLSCFLNVHNRPDAKIEEDWRNPALFHISGLPKKLVPSSIARLTDFSEVRCLDKNILTGFAKNGYVENIRHIDENGLIHGEEVGYMNDPKYPVRQGPEWGKILWTSKYKRGKRDGISTFYRSNVLDGSDSTYYFKHLEVPYTQDFVNGTVKMYSYKNFLMAEIPYKRNAMHGRMVVHNPFKKKNLTLTFVAGDLEGFVDFGDFGGVYHKGLPNGVVTFWTVKDSCYQWMPGNSVCYSQRLTKKQWGTYKMGIFQGKMECANGLKGGVDLICPDLDTNMVKKLAKDAADAIKNKDKADSIAKEKAADSLNVASDSLAKKQEAIEAAQKAKLEAQKARLEAEKALQEAKLAEEAALKAEKQAEEAEKSLQTNSPAAPKKPAKEKKSKKSKKSSKKKTR